MTLGHFIYALRRSLGLTQRKFSEQLQQLEEQEEPARYRYVDPRYIQRWEHDEHRPRQATVSRIRRLDAPLFDKLWLSALRQHEFQQFVSEVARSRRSRTNYRFGC